MASSGRGNSIDKEARMIAPGILAGVVAFLASAGAFFASSPLWQSPAPVTAAVMLVPPATIVLLVLLPGRHSASSPTHPFSTAGGTLVGNLIGQIGPGLAPPFNTWWYGPLLFPSAFTYAAFALSFLATRTDALPKFGLALHLSVPSAIYLSLGVAFLGTALGWWGRPLGCAEGCGFTENYYTGLVLLSLYLILVGAALVKFLWPRQAGVSPSGEGG